MAEEFRLLDELIGTFLATPEAKLETSVAQARQRGMRYGPDRSALFQALFEELRARAQSLRPAGRMADSAKRISPSLRRIPPTTRAHRNNYVSALKALSQSGKSTPIVRVFDSAPRYTASVRWKDFNAARADLQTTDAFLDAKEAEDKGIRLMLPKEVRQ